MLLKGEEVYEEVPPPSLEWMNDYIQVGLENNKKGNK